MADTITLTCKECGNTVERKKNCPYTGIEHGRGWVYICDCRGEMEVVDIVPESPFLCDILTDAFDTGPLLPWKIFRQENRPKPDDKPLWETSVIEQTKDANKSIDELFFDTLAAAGKRLDMEEVPTNGRTLKIWAFNDDSEIS